MWREFVRRHAVKICSLLNSEACSCRTRSSARCFHLSARSSSNGGNYNPSDEVDAVGNENSGEYQQSHTTSGEDLAGSVSAKYRIFRDEDSEIILDVDEERRKFQTKAEEVEVDEFAGITLKRGVTGVFDLEELVEILENQKAKDIFVIQVPPSYCYVSHMVLATGHSARHLVALTEFIRKVYKRKVDCKGRIVKIEGADSKNWMALDLGNIALHVFLKSTREEYDLESLWSLGADYDNLCRNEDDPLIALFDKSFGLGGLEPASSSGHK